MKTCMMLVAALAAASLAGAEPSVRIDGRPRWTALRAKAVALAKANMETVEGWRPQMTCMPGVGKIWQWDSCFMALFAGLAPSGCDGLGNLDNLYAMQSADGYMSMAYVYATKRPAFGERVNPPLFAWAEWLYARRTGDLSRLPRAYDASARLFAWLKANRTRPCNGLYWFEDTGSSGMDNSPRSGYGAKHLDGSDVCWVDLSCQQVLTARCLAKMAPLVGRAAEAAKCGKPFIVCGDWNDEAESPALAKMREGFQLLSQTDAPTFFGYKPGTTARCIDYIAIDAAHAASLKIAAPSRVVRAEGVSDHALLEMDVVLKK